MASSFSWSNLSRVSAGRLDGPLLDAIREYPAVFAQVRADHGTIV
jgi:hypothetical protein